MYKFAKKVANHEGFTLVELIVVIAILGILAGIAIPVYSGYIKKANQAADVMLLGAVNTAVAAACAENNFVKLDDCGVDVSDSEPYKIEGINPTITTLSDESEAIAAVVANVKEDFLKYFGDNVNTELKVTAEDDFIWKKDEQCFGIKGVAGTSGTATTYSFFGTNVTINSTDAANLQNSVFGQMGAVNLTNNVAKVTTVAEDLLAAGRGESYMSDPGFVSFMTGILPEGTTVADLSAAQKANALVLYAANQSAGKSGSDYVTAFTTNQTQTALNLRKNDPAYLSDAAAAFATMLAFANSEYGDKYEIGGQTVKDYFAAKTNSLAHMSDIVTMLNEMNTATLKTGETSDIEETGKTAMYVYTETKAASQLDGYLSALNMVDSNLSNISSDNILSLLGSGYASQDVVALLGQIIGN